MTENEGHAVPLDANLSRSPDKQYGVRWPVAVDAKLDRLVSAAEEAGERTHRKELIAALIATCRLTGPQLSKALRTYRQMTVRDALGSAQTGSGVVHLVDHKPGRRSARS